MPEYERSGIEMSEIRKVLGTEGPDAKGPEENVRPQKVRIFLFSQNLSGIKYQGRYLIFFPKMYQEFVAIFWWPDRSWPEVL